VGLEKQDLLYRPAVEIDPIGQVHLAPKQDDGPLGGERRIQDGIDPSGHQRPKQAACEPGHHQHSQTEAKQQR